MTAKMVESASLIPGGAAPDITLPDSDGFDQRLSTFWACAARGVVLVFLRHFG